MELVSSRMMMMMMMIVLEVEEVGVFGLRLHHLDVILSHTDLLFCVINALTERKSQVHNCGFFWH